MNFRSKVKEASTLGVQNVVFSSTKSFYSETSNTGSDLNYKVLEQFTILSIVFVTYLFAKFLSKR